MFGKQGKRSMLIAQQLVSKYTRQKETGRQNTRGKIKINGQTNDQNSRFLLKL